jgi:energy-coupling factor transport system substrate-specific component
MRTRLSLSLLITFSLLGFIWPFLVPSQGLADRASWFFLASTPIAVALIVALVSQEELGSKKIALLGTLTALIAALRPLGIGAIGIEPMWFALILAARAMGPTFGFLLGSLSMLLSALLTGGVGPWLAYQVCAAALIGTGVALIPSSVRGRSEVLALILYGVIASAIFGIAMNLQFWPWALGSGTELSYLPGAPLTENLTRFFSYHFLSSLAWDIPRAILTATLIAVAAHPVLNALRRLQMRSRFVEPHEIEELASANVRAKQPSVDR